MQAVFALQVFGSRVESYAVEMGNQKTTGYFILHKTIGVFVHEILQDIAEIHGVPWYLAVLHVHRPYHGWHGHCGIIILAIVQYSTVSRTWMQSL